MIATREESEAASEPLIEIFSPVPPMQTGSADYLDTVLERVSVVPGCTARIRIAIDPDFIFDGAAVPEQVHGARVEDYRTFSNDVPVGRTRIFFLGNNDHHAYAYAALAQQSSLAEGRTISVIHDPSVFMLHRFRMGNGNHRLTQADLTASASAQYGNVTSRFVSARMDGYMPELFEYVTHSQGAVLDNSHEVWVHSVFAMAKLTLESNIRATRLPTIRVAAHPEPHTMQKPEAEIAGDHFRIGCFGWITPVKRIISIVRGLALAFDRLPNDARGKIELFIVGRKPHDSPYDPLGVAADLDIADAVQMIDYPPAGEFRRLQASCRLILNLRYPSCGESSGTLATAVHTEAQVVTSRYQAFHEVSSGCTTVTTLPAFEELEIASVICAAYLARQTDPAAMSQPSAIGGKICPVEKFLLYEIISQSNAARLQNVVEEMA